MKHFAFKAAAIAAAMFLFSFMASAQAALITDNENMQCTVLRLVSPEGEVNMICYLEWRGDSPITDFIFDTANSKIVDNQGSVYSGDAVKIHYALSTDNTTIEHIGPKSRVLVTIKVVGVGSEATAFTSIELPYKCTSDSGTLTGKFSRSNDLRFK